MAQWKRIQLGTMTFQVRSLASLSGLRIHRCHELWCRLQTGSLDPELLWLWHRPAAVALIRPLAWEPPYAMNAALKKDKRPKKKNFRRLLLVSGYQFNLQNTRRKKGRNQVHARR